MQLHAKCVGVDFCRRIAIIFAVRCVPVHVVEVKVETKNSRSATESAQLTESNYLISGHSIH